ncbi:MAG: ABC transporter ATP-binding protein [Anaerolineaceae bacterium]|nr:ABC transporter ATP-binding protein [Anaerolineaceae bacterium]
MEEPVLTTPQPIHDNEKIPSAEIVCEGVTKHFPGGAKPAVDHVSFRVAAGDLVALLGPSGCGKTTLLKMINRLYEPDEGRIWIGKQEIHTLPVNQLRRQIGYAIQQVGLFPHMTIRKNIAVVPRLLGWSREKIEQRSQDLLELVGLPASYLTRYPRQLSGGEQQRIGLARALAADPAILLMDEPFAAVDAINRERLQGELLEIHRKLHKTILFVTHDVEEAFHLADKIIILQAGKLVQHGTPLEIIMQPQNAFVEELTGANNMLRRLSLFTVQSALEARRNSPAQSRPFPEQAVIRPEDDLRSALAQLLESSGDALQVINASEELLGELKFEDLRALLVEGASRNQQPEQDELPHH